MSTMLKQNKTDLEFALTFLKGVGPFKLLDDKIISDLATRLNTLKFAAGEHVLKKGESGQYMLIIKQGLVTVELEDRDIEQGSGSVIGEISLLSDKPCKANVITQIKTEAYALYREDFQALMTKYNELAMAMTELMKSRMFGPEGINRLGKYKIIDELGEGGMSIVYNALDTILGREVAIKMLRYEVAAKHNFKERFRQEAITIANLRHSNILQVMEAIEDYSTEFIVMEKLDGYDLKYFIKHQGVFSGEQTCDVISQVALALEYAGNSRNGGIIHRDIKLANIVLDDTGHVRLMDFGIAVTSGEVTDNYEGTLPYMAPEVLQNKPFDYRIDIYALGVTAYAMLTGKTPFMAPTADTLIAKQINEPPPDIDGSIDDIPEGLAEFIKRALLKDPEERISSWPEIQSLLASGKDSSAALLANTDKDMAVVIKLKTSAIDTDLLVKEFQQVLDVHHAQYEIKTVTRNKADLDFEI